MKPPTLAEQPLVPLQAAAEKVREAEYFLRDLLVRDHNHTLEFRYVFNACLTAARSGFWFLRTNDLPAYSAWESSLALEDQELILAMHTVRDAAVHAGGAEMSPGKRVDRIPTPGDYRHTVELIRPDGSREVLPAVGALKRYLGLLRHKLGLVA